ncbi:MAG: YihY/virulence factor BrkB family protein [Sulfuriflexus sp.]|nr:YihY/virulence factor BrkB family protein [Sulfuriflexus sp.]
MLPDWRLANARIENYITRPMPKAGLARLGFQSARIAYCSVRDLLEGQLTLRAMSLVYTTLLSMVPLLALSFSVLKAFGVHNQVEPLLFDFLSRMGEQGIEIGQTIMGFVNNIKVGVLGAAGLLLLFITVISLIQKIERSFNYIWRIKHSRQLSRRFSDYLSVILVGPVLIFTSIGILASIKNAVIVQYLSSFFLIGDAIHLIGTLLPYILIIGAFCFVYIFMPNTKVNFKAALLGAVIAGFLWESTSWLFASFVASSGNYSAIYSSFAILVLFMIWLYLGWIILLLGANIAFYYQYPSVISSADECNCAEPAHQEQLVLQLMYLIALNLTQSKPPWTTSQLSNAIGQPLDLIADCLQHLVNAQLLSKAGDKQQLWLPIRDIDDIRVIDILAAIEGNDPTPTSNPDGAQSASKNIHQRVVQARRDSLGDESLKELVLNFSHASSSK